MSREKENLIKEIEAIEDPDVIEKVNVFIMGLIAQQEIDEAKQKRVLKTENEIH